MATKLVIHDWNGCLLDDVPHRFEHGPCAITLSDVRELAEVGIVPRGYCLPDVASLPTLIVADNLGAALWSIRAL